MEVLEIQNSSAIAKVSFDSTESLVGIAFTSKPDKYYYFECEDVDGFIEKLEEKINSKESLGKFVSEMRKEKILVSV